MTSRRVFNPDDYLHTPEGRVYTEERNAAAWEQIYLSLEALFAEAGPGTRLYVVMGVQGGGKSTWIRRNLSDLGPAAIVLEAALPARRHRSRVLELAKRFHVHAEAVWINPSLELALARNLQRPPDEVVPEFALRSVFDLLEAPSVDEGFHEMRVISNAASDA